jgi:hypothetical protein
MDLLDLAESILRGPGELSTEQRESVIKILDDEEQAAAQEEGAPATKLLTGEAAAAGGEVTDVAAQAAALEDEGMPAAEAEVEEAGRDLAAEPGKGDLSAEEELPFALDLTEDSGSIGWVSSEPEEDYYTGWGEAEEEETLSDWMPEEVFEEEDESARKEKKKGKKRRDKRSVDGEIEMGDWRWRG